MTPYISTITGNFGLCVFFESVFLSCFSVPLPPPPSLSLSFCPLMSDAHCAESSVSVVSVLLALNSWDRGWDDKASFFLFAHYSSHHYLKFIIPRKDGGRGTRWSDSRTRGGGGNKKGGEGKKKIIKNWSCGWNESKWQVAPAQLIVQDRLAWLEFRLLFGTYLLLSI